MKPTNEIKSLKAQIRELKSEVRDQTAWADEYFRLWIEVSKEFDAWRSELGIKSGVKPSKADSGEWSPDVAKFLKKFDAVQKRTAKSKLKL